MATYRVRFAVVHGTTAADSRRYEPGESIDLDDAAAAPLLEIGSIEGTEESPASQTAPKGKAQ